MGSVVPADVFHRECRRPDGPYNRLNFALMNNFNLAPISQCAFLYVGGDMWPRAMPNDPMPFIFTGILPEPFEQEFERKEREAREPAVAPAVTPSLPDSEQEPQQTDAGFLFPIHKPASPDASPLSIDSALPPLTTDVTSSSEDERLSPRDATKSSALLATMLYSKDLKRHHELEDQDSESSSAASSTSKRPRLSTYISLVRAAEKKTLPSSAHHVRYRSPKARYGFLTDSSSSKSRSTSYRSNSSATKPTSFAASLKRSRDDSSDAETSTSTASVSAPAKRRRVEMDARVILPMPTHAVTRHDKVTNWLTHGTLAAPAPEETAPNLTSDVTESGYDVDAESDDELHIEAPRFVSMKGRTVAERFQAPRKVHYAGSDAAEDDEPVPMWKVAEVLRYAVPNPGNWA
ncbi:unnamed protein product [Peniophora sp. CBMAI 1063]|nr:unnamed protein product [Peniophora sp. CBMAI 1063]